MALFMYPHNNYYAPARRQRYNPFVDIDRVFDAFLGDETQQLLPIPRISEDGKFTTTISTRDYNPSELKVEVDGRDLIVSGEHSSKDEHGGSVERRFVQRILIPESVDLQSVKCDYDDQTRALQFTGKATVEAPKNKSIPISFKNGTPAVENKENK